MSKSIDLEKMNLKTSSSTNLEVSSFIFSDDNELPSKFNNERHFGNCFVFWFRNDEPMITIGPHCNFFSLK